MFVIFSHVLDKVEEKKKHHLNGILTAFKGFNDYSNLLSRIVWNNKGCLPQLLILIFIDIPCNYFILLSQAWHVECGSSFVVRILFLVLLIKYYFSHSFCTRTIWFISIHFKRFPRQWPVSVREGSKPQR